MHWDLEESNQKNILKKYESDKHLNISRILAINITDIRFDSNEAIKLFNNIIFERNKIYMQKHLTQSKNIIFKIPTFDPEVKIEKCN
jgi:hypothetical protein